MRFRSYTQRRTTVGRTYLDEGLARHRDLYLTTHITLTADKCPCPRWDSSPRSQKANGRRPTPYCRTWEILANYSGVTAEASRPGCDAVSLGEQFLILGKIVLPSYTGSRTSCLWTYRHLVISKRRHPIVPVPPASLLRTNRYHLLFSEHRQPRTTPITIALAVRPSVRPFVPAYEAAW